MTLVWVALIVFEIPSQCNGTGVYSSPALFLVWLISYLAAAVSVLQGSVTLNKAKSGVWGHYVSVYNKIMHSFIFQPAVIDFGFRDILHEIEEDARF